MKPHLNIIGLQILWESSMETHINTRGNTSSMGVQHGNTGTLGIQHGKHTFTQKDKLCFHSGQLVLLSLLDMSVALIQHI